MFIIDIGLPLCGVACVMITSLVRDSEATVALRGLVSEEGVDGGDDGPGDVSCVGEKEL